MPAWLLGNAAVAGDIKRTLLLIAEGENIIFILEKTPDWVPGTDIRLTNI